MMKAIVFIVAFVHIIISALLILYTQETVDATRHLFQRFPLKYLSAIPAAIGLLFLIAAPATTQAVFLRVLGLLALLEALVAFTNPRKVYSRALNWYFENVSDQAQRLFGIVGIILGTAMLSWIK